MPLIHRKTPSAFKKNIEIEMEHGKPQKQAVAIAYHVKRDAEHRKMADGGCVGAHCKGCSSENCYAAGGEVGVHESIKDYQPGESGGTSVAGWNHRSGDKERMETAKYGHKKNLEDLKHMPKPKLYAAGGMTGYEKGIAPAYESDEKKGLSVAGEKVRSAHENRKKRIGSDVAERVAQRREGEARQASVGRMMEQSKIKPKLYAEGGSVESPSITKSAETGTYAPYSNEENDEEFENVGNSARAWRNEQAPKRMADGGMVTEPNKQNAADMQKGATSGSTSAGQAWANLKSGLGFAEGGEVDSRTKREDNERGVHATTNGPGTGSRAGTYARSAQSFTPEQDKGFNSEGAKREHHRVLGEMRSMKKPHLYAEGGEVDEDDNDGGLDKNHYVKGVHTPFAGQGRSQLGAASRGHWSHGSPERNKEKALREHKKVSSEMASMKKPNLYAEGGEVSDGEPEMEDELKQVMGDELMGALERKDRKAIMSTLEAIVLSCRGRE